MSTENGARAARRVLGPVATGAGLAAVAVGARAIARARSFTPPPPEPTPLVAAPGEAPATDDVATRLAALVRIPTIAPADGEPFGEAAADFERLAHELEAAYPLIFGAGERFSVGQHGILLRLSGRRGSERAVVLMAHQDVVPAPTVQSEWEELGWSRDPWAGVVADGSVWGRGSLDDKGALVALAEAVESMLAGGWSPPSDLWLLFSSDEEVSGDSAPSAAALLEARGVTPWLVLDEGGAVVDGAFPGMAEPMAVVGVSEKGLVDVEMSVEALGGHASTPPQMGATARLARAIVAIERNPHPAHLGQVTMSMLNVVGRHLPWNLRAVLAQAPEVRRPIAAVLARMSPELAAMVRTTTAVTRLEGSPAGNVLAARASAHLNVRVAVGSSCVDAVAHLERVISDPDVRLRVIRQFEPSPISPTDDERWAMLREAALASYPGTVVTPYVMLGASDARHLARISPAVYRFSPFAMTRAQRDSIHGADEHLTLDALGRGVEFYRQLLGRWA